jgi:hypothetical protein
MVGASSISNLILKYLLVRFIFARSASASMGLIVLPFSIATKMVYLKPLQMFIMRTPTISVIICFCAKLAILTPHHRYGINGGGFFDFIP